MGLEPTTFCLGSKFPPKAVFPSLFPTRDGLLRDRRAAARHQPGVADSASRWDRSYSLTQDVTERRTVPSDRRVTEGAYGWWPPRR
jgi:hypothetical protein